MIRSQTQTLVLMIECTSIYVQIEHMVAIQTPDQLGFATFIHNFLTFIHNFRRESKDTTFALEALSNSTKHLSQITYVCK